MPLGVSRLVLSISTIRRNVDVDIDNFEYITTQDGRVLQDQDLRFIALEQSDKITDTVASLGLDPLVTQDFDTAGDSFITQDGRALQTQNNRTILTQRES